MEWYTEWRVMLLDLCLQSMDPGRLVCIAHRVMETNFPVLLKHSGIPKCWGPVVPAQWFFERFFWLLSLPGLDQCSTLQVVHVHARGAVSGRYHRDDRFDCTCHVGCSRTTCFQHIGGYQLWIALFQQSGGGRIKNSWLWAISKEICVYDDIYDIRCLIVW